MPSKAVFTALWRLRWFAWVSTWSVPASRRACTMALWQPTALMVTTAPSKIMRSSKRGMAVISLLLAAHGIPLLGCFRWLGSDHRHGGSMSN